jgi:hypothetical protein
MTSRRFHVALAVDHVDGVAADSAERLGESPVVSIAGEYALWRTSEINLSISKARPDEERLRHVGFEDPEVETKTYSTDCSGLLWESSSSHQDDEIASIFHQ